VQPTHFPLCFVSQSIRFEIQNVSSNQLPLDMVAEVNTVKETLHQIISDDDGRATVLAKDPVGRAGDRIPAAPSDQADLAENFFRRPGF
jgi:hypothetical protein